ncbi:odorant receptor 85c-like [Zophobas morio]|uniref:odorant receptor 85c-like n=1 Tax=Zophobas morio TaxID=2755281 RepID=UPI0030827160
MTLPFFEIEHRLPLNVWLPYDVTSGSATFYATYFYLVAVCFYFGLVCEMMEPLIGGLVYQATSQLKILKYNLRHLSDHSVGSFESVSKTLIRCVVHHNKILNFLVEYEDCFSWCVFCQIAGTTFALCFCCVGVGLSLVSSFSMNFVMYVISYCVNAFQLLFYCHYGSLLYDENNELMSAIYMGPWYNYDVRVRKFLLIIMERSKIPLVLTAGKVINLTYATFTSVLKTSYSLIAVLNRHN